jgi:hypothetical protein
MTRNRYRIQWCQTSLLSIRTRQQVTSVVSPLNRKRLFPNYFVYTCLFYFLQNLLEYWSTRPSSTIRGWSASAKTGTARTLRTIPNSTEALKELCTRRFSFCVY